MVYSISVKGSCYPVAFPDSIPAARQGDLFNELVVQSDMLERLGRVEGEAARRAFLYGILRVVIAKETDQASVAPCVSKSLRLHGVRKRDLAA